MTPEEWSSRRERDGASGGDDGSSQERIGALEWARLHASSRSGLVYFWREALIGDVFHRATGKLLPAEAAHLLSGLPPELTVRTYEVGVWGFRLEGVLPDSGAPWNQAMFGDIGPSHQRAFAAVRERSPFPSRSQDTVFSPPSFSEVWNQDGEPSDSDVIGGADDPVPPYKGPCNIPCGVVVPIESASGEFPAGATSDERTEHFLAWVKKLKSTGIGEREEEARRIAAELAEDLCEKANHGCLCGEKVTCTILGTDSLPGKDGKRTFKYTWECNNAGVANPKPEDLDKIRCYEP